MMRAIVAAGGYGPPRSLHLVERPIPVPRDDEVLVRVRAAGVDRATWHQVTGHLWLLRAAKGWRTPRQPVAGRDLAGTVVRIGSAVRDLQPGDEVFGVGDGSWAQYTCAKADRLALRPAVVPAEIAAATPGSGVAALQALRDHARLSPGQRVLVIGAAGGVGSFAVSLARAMGAQVTGICRAERAQAVCALGAQQVFARDHWRPDDSPQVFDVIVDNAGVHPVAALRKALSPRGTLVLVGAHTPGRWTGGLARLAGAVIVDAFIGQRLQPMLADERSSELDALGQRLADGTLRPRLDAVLPLSRAADALERLAGGEVCGKLVLVP